MRVVGADDLGVALDVAHASPPGRRSWFGVQRAGCAACGSRRWQRARQRAFPVVGVPGPRR
jgi:hypothetical protein